MTTLETKQQSTKMVESEGETVWAYSFDEGSCGFSRTN